MAGSAFAQLVSKLDDFEGGSNMNLFGDYWYYYDDNKEASTFASVAATAGGKGNSKVFSAVVKGAGDTKELLFDPEVSIADGRSGKGAKLEFEWGNTFLTGYDNSNPDRSREPTFPNPVGGTSANDWKQGAYAFAPFVGIGTNLVAEGEKTAPAGFENATELKFWAKADAALSIWVYFEQSDIGWYANNTKRKEGTYYGVWKTISTAWAEYSVPLVASPCNGDPGKAGIWNCDEGETGLRQPMFVNKDEQDLVMPFDKTKLVKVAWQAQPASGGTATMGNANIAVPETTGDPPSAITGDGITGYSNILYLDDISFTGFRFVAKDMCETCIASALPTDATRFDKFSEAAYQSQNVLGHYWYVYDDQKTKTDNGVKGTSEIGNDGVEKDCASPNVDVTKGECEVLIQTDPTGNYLSGEFELGKALKIDGENVQPFVGIGTNLYDEKAATLAFFDADAAGVKGLYFEYRTSGEVGKVTFEVQDKWDADSTATGRPAASVYYIDLPATGGVWNKANVAFSKLVQHTSWAVVNEWNAANPTKVALDTKNLAKFQFKIQDGSGKTGVLQIRDVYTLGASGVSAKYAVSKRSLESLRATYNRGVVGVSWAAAQNIASGKVSLVNVKGRTIASAPLVKAGGKVTANLGKGSIPTGMYFVRINAKDVQGKKVVQQVPLSIVK
jgi:hypothetical protein